MHGTLNDQGDIGVSEQFTGTAANWYALLVESNAERKACIWLRRRQYEPYWPRYRGQVKLNRHRRVERWRSVIAGYLFLPADRLPNWRLLKEEMPGYRSTLRNGTGDVVKIPDQGHEGIQRIREIEEALNASPIAAAQGIPFKVKQRVRIPRLDLEGTIKSIEKGRRVIVDLMFLGAIRPIPLPVSEIEAV